MLGGLGVISVSTVLDGICVHMGMITMCLYSARCIIV